MNNQKQTPVDGKGEGMQILPEIFFTIPIDVEGSNIAKDGWYPSEEECKHLPAGSFDKYKKEYEDKNAKVIFKNTHLNWDSCDCGDGYGCNHSDWVESISIINAEITHDVCIEDGINLLIENKVNHHSLLIPISSTIGDFHRACKLCDIELELTNYALSLVSPTHTQSDLIDKWEKGVNEEGLYYYKLQGSGAIRIQKVVKVILKENGNYILCIDNGDGYIDVSLTKREWLKIPSPDQLLSDLKSIRLKEEWEGVIQQLSVIRDYFNRPGGDSSEESMYHITLDAIIDKLSKR